MASFISLSDAITITTQFRSQKENVLISALRNQGILPICETFDVSSINDLISQDDCTDLRVYLAMDDNYKVKLVIVGVDSRGDDILPKDNEKILQDALRCPTSCPPSSPLNS